MYLGGSHLDKVGLHLAAVVDQQRRRRRHSSAERPVHTDAVVDQQGPFQQTALPDDGAKVAGIAHSQPQRLVLLRTLAPILDDGEADAWGGAVGRPTEQSEGLRLLHERSRFDDQCADASIAGL